MNWTWSIEFTRFIFVMQILSAIIISKIIHQNMLARKRKAMLDILKEDLRTEMKTWI